MKKHWRILWITILGLGFTVGIPAAGLTKPMPPEYFVLDVRVDSYDPTSGRATLSLGLNWGKDFTFSSDCNNDMTVRLSNLDGVRYAGPESWTVHIEPGGPMVESRAEVILPPDDTGGLTIALECNSAGFPWTMYFIVSSDHVRVVEGDPRKSSDRFFVPDSVQTRLLQEEMARQLAEQRRPKTPPQEDSPQQTIIFPGDSALADSLTLEGKRRLAAMRFREREPLVGDETETWYIEGRWFFRLRGERTFRRISPPLQNPPK